MIDFLNNIDTQLLLFLNGLRTEWMDSFMWMATGRFVWVPMYATILFILLRSFQRREALLFTLAVILTIVFADQVCASLLRPLFTRLRPANPENPISRFVNIVNDYRGGAYGFPSCHGANSFGLATIMALIIRSQRFSRFIFFWAILNSYTRIYLGVHYPGDIIAGGLIGSAGAFAVYHAITGMARFISARFGLPPFNFHNNNSRSDILLTYPAGLLTPVMRLNVVYFRAYDLLPAIGATTMLILFIIALF